MAAQRMICSACGYDTAGLPVAGARVTCPECGHTGPPLLEAVERVRPWVVVAVVAAAVTNVFALVSSLLLVWICFQADWSQDEAVAAAIGPALLALLSGLTLVAMAFSTGRRAKALRLIMTVVHAVVIVAACVQAFRWAAGLETGTPLSIVSVLIGQPITSLVALNVRWHGRVRRRGGEGAPSEH